MPPQRFGNPDKVGPGRPPIITNQNSPLLISTGAAWSITRTSPAHLPSPPAAVAQTGAPPAAACGGAGSGRVPPGAEARVTTLMSGCLVWMSTNPRMTSPSSTESQISFPVTSERSANRSAGMSMRTAPRLCHQDRISLRANPAQALRTIPRSPEPVTSLPGL